MSERASERASARARERERERERDLRLRRHVVGGRNTVSYAKLHAVACSNAADQVKIICMQ